MKEATEARAVIEAIAVIEEIVAIVLVASRVNTLKALLAHRPRLPMCLQLRLPRPRARTSKLASDHCRE